MIKFIVVDDNKYNIEDVNRLILNYMHNTNYNYDIFAYEDITDDIFDKIESCYDKCVYLLDYYLPNGTAIDIARRIRKTDWSSPIIIFTAEDPSIGLSAFKERLQILDFILKDSNYQKNLKEALDVCINQLNYTEKFSVKSSFMDYNFEYDKILYIYKNNNERKITVVTDYGEFVLSYTLDKFSKYLNHNFVYTHKSCIVNKARVNVFDWKNNKFVLDNGEEVYLLSRLRRKELMDCGNS